MLSSIFNYHDYRKFLADYYHAKKTSHSAFSYQNFSRKAGFHSKSFMFNVINGLKNLSRASVVKICEALELSKTEAAYFENLVYFNQAPNFTERNFYYEKLNAIHPVTTEAGNARRLRKDQYEFYSNWYHVVIRSLLDLYPDVKDYKQLAKMVYPAIRPKQAQKSVELLLRLGLIEKRKDETYKISSKVLSTGKEVQSLAAQHFHLACMELAAKALRELPKDKRNISGLTLGISPKAYEKIREMIYLTQEKILEVAEKDSDSDRVYQLNFHFFPVSRTTPDPSLTRRGA
ncbi:MAG: TIGR02147 family protein [Chitinispirillaceae bacterium]|nr:TIGR02147 family protein [Chitinispirillaceae bacterium]